MDAATRKTLKSLSRTRTPAELKALFKTIRAKSDAALLADITPKKKARPRKPADFATRIADRLAIIHGPAGDKADALIGVLEEKCGPVEIAGTGLVPIIRKLAARYGEKAVSGATDTLMKKIAAMGSMRETVK
jgi:hypothetical protein